MSDPTQRALQLIEEGYLQISSKYRLVARLPLNKSGLEALAEVDPGLAANFLGNADHQAARQFMRCYAKGEDKLELSEEEFRAFRKLGGDSA